MARVTGLEPAASGVTGRRSNQLSYTRVLVAGKYDMALPLSMVERKESVIHYLTGLFPKGKLVYTNFPAPASQGRGAPINRTHCGRQTPRIRSIDGWMQGLGR
jgi:hypothetical protein